MKAMDYEQINPILLTVLITLITILIGWLDYLAGESYSLFLLYIFPIFILSWSLNRTSGIVIAAVSGLLWSYVDFGLLTNNSNLKHILFSSLTRMALFVIMAFLFSGHRRLYDKIQNQAHRDKKTGAYNYEAFLEFSEREVNRSRRLGTQLALAYFDLDKFKEVNDKFGHLEGDKVLFEFASIAQGAIRSTDLFARIGGDEFLALFVDVDIEQVHKVLERIQTSFNQEMNNRNLSVTVSIGATDLFPPEESLERIVHQADQLMYKAKLEGRDRIRIFSNKKEQISRDLFNK